MQAAATTAFLLVAFILAFLVVLRPTLRPDRLGIAAVIALVAGTALGWGDVWILPAWSVLPLLVAALVLIPAVAIARSFGRVDMIAFLFHKEFGMQGAALASLKNEIATATISALLILIATCGLSSYWALETTVPLLVATMLLLANPFVRFGAMRLLKRPVTSVRGRKSLVVPG